MEAPICLQNSCQKRETNWGSLSETTSTGRPWIRKTMDQEDVVNNQFGQLHGLRIRQRRLRWWLALERLDLLQPPGRAGIQESLTHLRPSTRVAKLIKPSRFRGNSWVAFLSWISKLSPSRNIARSDPSFQ